MSRRLLTVLPVSLMAALVLGLPPAALAYLAAHQPAPLMVAPVVTVLVPTPDQLAAFQAEADQLQQRFAMSVDVAERAALLSRLKELSAVPGIVLPAELME